MTLCALTEQNRTEQKHTNYRNKSEDNPQRNACKGGLVGTGTAVTHPCGRTRGQEQNLHIIHVASGREAQKFHSLCFVAPSVGNTTMEQISNTFLDQQQHTPNTSNTRNATLNNQTHTEHKHKQTHGQTQQHIHNQ